MNEQVKVSAFRPATRSEAKPLIGLYAESGCGKTYSALLLARGFVGPSGKIGMIESEGGRGEANVGREPIGQYLVRPIRQDFSPQEYGRAITEAENENLDALIVDSASHEWEGVGGVLDMAAKNLAAGKKGVLVWQQPKIEHGKYFMLRLMQTPIPLVIVCMRAKYPMEQIKGGEWARSKVLEPKQSEDILSEMFVHAWIDRAHNVHVTKYTLPELENIIVDGQPISVETGRRLALWAKGGSPVGAQRPTPSADAPAPPVYGNPQDGAGEASIDELGKCDALLAAAAKHGVESLKTTWDLIPSSVKPTLKSALDRRHKPAATKADSIAAANAAIAADAELAKGEG